MRHTGWADTFRVRTMEKWALVVQGYSSMMKLSFHTSGHIKILSCRTWANEQPNTLQK